MTKAKHDLRSQAQIEAFVKAFDIIAAIVAFGLAIVRCFFPAVRFTRRARIVLVANAIIVTAKFFRWTASLVQNVVAVATSEYLAHLGE
jgi:hypothetical protein